MTTRLLSWADAEPDDREQLKQFKCTEPPERTPTSAYRRVYARQHERSAEKLVHGLVPAKVDARHQRIWVGKDADGIGAVICWEWQPDDSLLVVVAALHNRLRKKGTQYTAEMMDTAQSQAMGEAVARGLRSVDVGAVIHNANSASRYFAGRFGMVPVAVVDVHHRVYGITLDLGDTA